MRMSVRSQNPKLGRPRTGGSRERILDAALQLFAERGFHGVAMPDLAAVAGIAAATIYRHFTGKEALVNELYQRCKALLVQRLEAQLLSTAPLRERFHELWWTLVRFAREESRTFAFLELHHHGDYLNAQSRAIELDALLPIATLLEKGRAAGIIKDLPPAPLIVTVWGAFVGMNKAARLGYFELTDELCAQVEETCWDAIAV